MSKTDELLKQATARPWPQEAEPPFALGLETDPDAGTAQIISAAGWHVATVSISPATEVARAIVLAVNTFEQAREALKEVLGFLDDGTPEDGISPYERTIRGMVRAAIAAMEGGDDA